MRGPVFAMCFGLTFIGVLFGLAFAFRPTPAEFHARCVEDCAWRATKSHSPREAFDLCVQEICR